MLLSDIATVQGWVTAQEKRKLLVFDSADGVSGDGGDG